MTASNKSIRGFSSLASRVADAGGDPWALHWQARHAAKRGEDVIVLSVGDPDIDTPEPIIDRAVTALRSGDTHYTEGAGRPALRAAVAELHFKRTGLRVTPEQTLVVGGTQNGLFIASLLVAEHGDEVIAIDPMYTTYPPTIEASGARLVSVPAPASKGFHVDIKLIEAAITDNTKALFLATPNNPTGIVLTDDDCDGIAAIAAKHHLWIISDEVYAGIADEGRVPSLAKRLPDQVITIGSLSKSHAMTGFRSGWMVGPVDFVKHAENLIQSMLYGLPGFVQEAAIAAIGMAEQTQNQMREFCHLRRQQCFEGLSHIKNAKPIWPDAGMFMLLDVRGTGLSAPQFVQKLYQHEKVSLLQGDVFGAETKGFVRVCFAVSEREIKRACERIARFCHSLS